jgi:hypothetical protein
MKNNTINGGKKKSKKENEHMKKYKDDIKYQASEGELLELKKQ